jgi:hypothetical protein
MNFLRSIPIILIVSSSSSLVLSSDYTLNGFASLTGGMTLDNEESYLDYDNQWSMKNESKVGFQLDADLDSDLSATLQFMARGKDDFNAELEWGYISYQLTDTSDLKFGKLRLPIYYYSSSLDVGFSYEWIRPPEDVYSLPISSFEGLDYSNAFELGEWNAYSQFFFGSNRKDIVTSSDIDLTQVAGAVFEIGHDWFNTRLSATNGKVEGLTTQSDINYYSIAFFAELSEIMLFTEFTLADITSQYSVLTADEEIKSYLISASYALNTLTPYLTYSDSRAVAPESFSIYGDIDEQSWIYGVRWDFNAKASLKAEYIDKTDHIKASNNAQLASISVDFIF